MTVETTCTTTSTPVRPGRVRGVGDQLTGGRQHDRTVPEEPPEGVTAELLWRLATRLHRDHPMVSGPAHGLPGAPDHTGRCRCRQPWPCSGRRLAELALRAAAS